MDIEKEVITEDGHKIMARIFFTERKSLGAVLIVPAIGVTQEYYAAFATWLSEHSFLAVTFDYRGMGASRRGGLRGFQADILDWAKQDCTAMIDTIQALATDKPIYWIGHSLGGQILAFVPNITKITKGFFITSGSGYWRENVPELRWRVWWLWYVAVPIATSICGYFPGKRLRKVGDLPKGVILQWRRWCLNPDYAAGAEGEMARALYTAVQTPIISISFTDDEFMSARNIDSLLAFYSHATKIIKRVAPEDIGVKRIGHFGFFKKQFADSLWQMYLLPELQNIPR